MADESYKPQIDRDKVEKMAEHTMGFLGGAVISGMIYLGDKMGLYRALDGAGPVTSDDLAQKPVCTSAGCENGSKARQPPACLSIRAIASLSYPPKRPWSYPTKTARRFWAGGFCSLPQQMGVIERLPESFQTGLGLPYDAFGPEGARGIERFLAPWFQAHLVPKALPALDGVVPKLEAGARVADVGCGPAWRCSRSPKPFRRLSVTATISRNTPGPGRREQGQSRRAERRLSRRERGRHSHG